MSAIIQGYLQMSHRRFGACVRCVARLVNEDKRDGAYIMLSSTSEAGSPAERGVTDEGVETVLLQGRLEGLLWSKQGVRICIRPAFYKPTGSAASRRTDHTPENPEGVRVFAPVGFTNEVWSVPLSSILSLSEAKEP